MAAKLQLTSGFHRALITQLALSTPW